LQEVNQREGETTFSFPDAGKKAKSRGEAAEKVDVCSKEGKSTAQRKEREVEVSSLHHKNQGKRERERQYFAGVADAEEKGGL